MPERIFVTGGSGFVGGAVIDELLSRGFGVNALIHQKDLPIPGDVQCFKGGLFDTRALDAAIIGCVAAIHLVGIIREVPAHDVTFQKMHVEGTKVVVDAAKARGVRRFIHMSALGTRDGAISQYHKTKWQAEEYVRASGLDWTILRPGLIHGPTGELMKMEIKWAKKQAPPYLFMPYFAGGLFGHRPAGILQPVYVKDVARAFVDCLSNPKTIGQTYGLGGSERISWPKFHQTISRAFIGKSRLTLPIPAWWANVLTRITPPSLLPFNRDQIIMSREDNTTEMSGFERDFGWVPRGFSETLREYSSADFPTLRKEQGLD